MVSQFLLVTYWIVPLGFLAGLPFEPVRRRILSLLWLAPLPGLAAAAVSGPDVGFLLMQDSLSFTLHLDRSSALLLAAASLLWSLAGLYAAGYMRKDPHPARFCGWWLLTMSGSLGVFSAGDIGSFYLAFAVVSLAAWGMVNHEDTAKARRASSIYIALAVLGEICLFMAFALLAVYSPSQSLAIEPLLESFPTNPARHYVVALMIAGFGLKMGLVPLHVWLPIAHPAAPMPASAVLSGAIIKAGVIGLLKFLPADGAVADWGVFLVVLGLLTALYAALMGLFQKNPKTILAYSSVSQMGGVAAVLGGGLFGSSVWVVHPAVLLACNHVLAKGALFMAVGIAASTRGGRFWLIMAPATVLALSLAGLPLTLGAAAKLGAKELLDVQPAKLIYSLTAIGTTVIMLHFVTQLQRLSPKAAAKSAHPLMLLAWLALAGLAVMMPWVVSPESIVPGVSILQTTPYLWTLGWPILVGIVLFLLLRRHAETLPIFPEGDILVYGEKAGHGVASIGRYAEWVEQYLSTKLGLIIVLIALLAALMTLMLAG